MEMTANAPAKEKTARKTREQNGEDVAYTINHAFACMTTDLASPFIANWTQKYLGKRWNIGCTDLTHSHAPGEAHDHAHDQGKPVSHFKHYLKGELIGDFGAVPITVAMVRYAPGFMKSLGETLEPVLGPIFRNGAKRSAQLWASEQTQTPDAAAVNTKENELYNYEKTHWAQAGVWSVVASVIGIASQKWDLKIGGKQLLTPNTGKLSHIIASKLAGTALSAALVIGGRALSPEKAHKLDNFAARTVFAPATKVTSRLFGVGGDAAERLEEKNGDYNVKGGWADQARKAQIEANRAAAAHR